MSVDSKGCRPLGKGKGRIWDGQVFRTDTLGYSCGNIMVMYKQDSGVLLENYVHPRHHPDLHILNVHLATEKIKYFLHWRSMLAVDGYCESFPLWIPWVTGLNFQHDRSWLSPMGPNRMKWGLSSETTRSQQQTFITNCGLGVLKTGAFTRWNCLTKRNHISVLWEAQYPLLTQSKS